MSTNPTDYLHRLFAPPDARAASGGAPLGPGAHVDDDTLAAIAGTARLPRGYETRTAEDDLALRARLYAFCIDVGLGRTQALGVLTEYGSPIDMEAFKGLLASVAVVAAPRTAETARHQAAVSEVTMAIAATGIPRAAQNDRREGAAS